MKVYLMYHRRRFLKHIWLIFQIENMNKCMK